MNCLWIVRVFGKNFDGQRKGKGGNSSVCGRIICNALLQGKIKMTQASKQDNEKVPLDLLPTEALWEIAKALQFGIKTKQYPRQNWREGFDWSRLYGACLRHLFAWAEGEDINKESGLLHLAHAGFNILALITHQKLGYGRDNRVKTNEIQKNERKVRNV